MKVYVYKEYRDDYAYDEEFILTFASKEDAEKTLREHVEHFFGKMWDQIPEELEEQDTFKNDFVSVPDENGALFFWIIEEHDLL